MHEVTSTVTFSGTYNLDGDQIKGNESEIVNDYLGQNICKWQISLHRFQLLILILQGQVSSLRAAQQPLFIKAPASLLQRVSAAF